MGAKRPKSLWGSNRTKQIIIQDDTCSGDMIKWRLLVKFFFPKYQDRFILMVSPNDTIGAIKAYIQEERGIAFKKQKILTEDGEDVSDVQTLVSLGIINKDSFLILRYAPVIAELSVRMLLMSFVVKDPWLLSRTMEIFIYDDTYKDVIKLGPSSKVMLPVRRPNNTICTIKNRRISYSLMVGPEDTIAAVKAYIYEKSGLYFGTQKLWNEDATVLCDNAQTLSSIGIKKGSALILRLQYGDVYSVKIKPSDTVGDIEAVIQKKAGVSLKLRCRGRRLAKHELISDLDI